MLSSHNIRCPFCDSLLVTKPGVGLNYIWRACPKPTMIQEFISIYHGETGALITEELFFPKTNFQLVNNYLDYPRGNGARIYNVSWDVNEGRVKSKFIMGLDQALALDLENWEAALAAIRTLIVFS